MCGIVGAVSLDGGPIDLQALQRMNDLQAHRGPDGEGFMLGWIEDGAFKQSFAQRAWRSDSGARARVGLGHRRLAILDLSVRGSQPMSSDDGATWIVFNGEIYNFRELRSELESRGRSFKTGTDTEALLQAYLQWGEDCLERLQGMYGFAIWDGRRGRLFCARDRLGIKPFYYATPKGYFIFASEIKGLLPFPGFDVEADDDAVVGFLVHGNCDYGERTVLKGVKALLAGHALTLDVAPKQLAIKRYWGLKPNQDKVAPASEASAEGMDEERVTGLRERLLDTMRLHLISDVRAGSCLSGGLDSSVVVGLIGKIQSEQPEAARSVGDSLFTFTSCYEYKEIDEREYALAMANDVKATPHLVFPSADDFWSDFGRMAWHQDMPFNGLAYYAQWRVMRAAKETGVKVLLDGQGGDEVFGGYAKFRYAYIASLLRSGRLFKIAREVGAMIRQGDGGYVLNIRNGYRYLPKRARRLLKIDSMLQSAMRADWNRVLIDNSSPAARWWRNAAGGGKGAGTAMQRIQIDDILIDTLPLILRMEDRSSMAFSIEARVPLLDHKLVEYGVSLPDEFKVRRGWSKYAVRQAVRGIIPERVRLRRSKLGFPAPDRLWVQRDLRRQITELIADDLRCQKYIDSAHLRRWNASPQADAATTESWLGLFRVLSLEMWMRAFKVS
ncbi:MAG: asparagine synthase (glutamine-hydrolyzing) [Chloracidobacterium sp.]|nr:asparagine synthase (glutamine-hydrolyzing) [Chloracidobacterium sp.]